MSGVDDLWEGVIKSTLAIPDPPGNLNPFKSQGLTYKVSYIKSNGDKGSLHSLPDYETLQLQGESAISTKQKELISRGPDLSEKELHRTLEYITTCFNHGDIEEVAKYISNVEETNLCLLGSQLKDRDVSQFVHLLNCSDVQLEVKRKVISTVLCYKVELSNKIWPRSIIEEISKFTLENKEIVVKCLIIPLVKSQHLNKYSLDFVLKLIKLALVTEDGEMCLRHFLREKICWNDHVCQCLELLVLREIDSDLVQLFCFTAEQFSTDLSQSLKFGSLLNQFLKYNGRNVNRESRFHLERIVNDMQSSMKKSVETALMNI